MWDDMAREFDKSSAKTMEGPVVIAASSCRCTRRVKDDNEVWECVDHGPQPEPTYRYHFKAFVSDETVAIMLTFFTRVSMPLSTMNIPEMFGKL
ncbi:nucleic acid-binding, OB-fold protein [Tanacetum coccineum]